MLKNKMDILNSNLSDKMKINDDMFSDFLIMFTLN